MGTEYGNRSIVTSGLTLYLDAGNLKSYPTSGTTWTDLTKNGNNSTLTNCTFNSSNLGNIVFNGSTSYIACGLAQSVGSDPTLPFSVSVWVKKNASNGAYQSVVERYQGITITNKFGWYIALDMNKIGNYSVGDLSVVMNNSQVIDSIVTSTGSSVLNEWKNVTFTYDGSNGYLYVDGVLKDSKAKPTGTISANSRNLNMGYTSVSPGQYLNGNVVNLLLYNRTLSASEVLQNYNATKWRFQ